MPGTDTTLNKVRKISLVSSAIFNITACVFHWMTPLGIVLGCVSDLAEIYGNDEISNEEALELLIKEALDKTMNDITISSHKKIIEELYTEKIVFDSIEDIIKKTESYQAEYCTNIDAQAIIVMFEKNFFECLSHYDALSKWYMLTMGRSMLDELKNICLLISNQEKKLDDINNTVNETKSLLEKIISIYSKISQEIAYILVSMSIFLGFGLFRTNGFPNSWISAAIVCFSLSSYFSYHLSEGGSIYKSIYDIWFHGDTDKQFQTKNYFSRFMKLLRTFLLPLMINIACFLVYICAIDDRNIIALPQAICALTLGSITSILLRASSIHKKTNI